MTRPTRLAIVLLLLVPLGLTGLSIPADAATKGRLTARHTTVVPGEDVSFTAKVPGHRRPIVMQRRKGSRWVTVKASKQYLGPSWRIWFRAPRATTRYRVHARRAKVKGRWLPAVNTPAVTLRTVASTVSLSLPATAPVGGSVTAVATFRPARRGWHSTLQVRDASGTWRVMGAALQDSAGRARFTVPTSGAGAFVYRAVRPAQSHAPTLVGSPASIRVGSGSATLVSVGDPRFGGPAGNDHSGAPAVSANGRVVAFSSWATNLTSDVTTSSSIYVRDLDSGTTTMVTPPAAISSLLPSISADGRYVAFQTDGALVPLDTFGSEDVYVFDRKERTYTLVSATPSGAPGDSGSTNATISADGRHVLFRSFASDLVAGDTNGQSDAFVRDLDAGTTELVSVSSAEAQGDRLSDAGDLSADGRLVVFVSASTNLVAGDTNAKSDVFLRDRTAGTTVRLSQSDTGGQGDWSASDAAISDDGRYVAYSSYATTIVPGDPDLGDDVYRLDRQTGTTVRVSHSHPASLPGQKVFGSMAAAISGDGRFVAYESTNEDVLPRDDPSSRDIYLWDSQTGVKTRLTSPTTGSSSQPALDEDGSVVMFGSWAQWLVPIPTPYLRGQVYAWSR